MQHRMARCQLNNDYLSIYFILQICHILKGLCWIIYPSLKMAIFYDGTLGRLHTNRAVYISF